MGSVSTVERTPGDRQPVRAPAIVGRYVLGASVGRGGQGEVFSAYDVELQRSVAIKILQPDGESPRDELVRREARALARLDHPNVVAVHDVGTCRWDADQTATYLVLELVDGRRIDHWVTAEARSIDEIVDVMLQIGEGLRAAHDRGLVHGDFKPSNVLVSDRGVAKVLDFGLARALADTEALPDDTTEPTSAGCGGTPEYMAPEQHRGIASDALSDQYAYCLCFFETLLGRRLFGGYTRSDLATAKHIGPWTTRTTDRGVPRWLARILRRGMAVRRIDRFDSMTTLLARIRRARAVHRWAARSARMAVFVAAAVGLGLAAHGYLAELRCESNVGSPESWIGEAPAEGPRAVTSMVALGLNEGASKLRRHRLDACGRFDGDPPSEVTRCFDAIELRLRAIDALGRRSLAEADRLAYLASLERGDSRTCLGERPVVDADPQDLDGAWMRLVVEAGALEMAGRFPEAMRTLEPWLDALPTTGWARTRAEFVYGWSAFRTGETELAERHLRRGIDAAAADGDERMRLSMLLHLMTVARKRGRTEAAAELQRHVAARAEELGDRRLLAEYEFHTALLDADAGDTKQAMARLTRALQDYEATLPAVHPHIGFTLTAMGAIARRLGRNDEAERYLEDARRRLAAGLGPNDARIATVHLNGSNMMFDDGRFAQAERELRRALAILAARRPVHAQPDTEGLIRVNLGEMALLQGRFADALAQLDQVELAVRPGNTRWAVQRARALVGLGRAAEASDLLASYVEEQEQAEPAASVDLAVLRCELGRTELFAGRPDEARRLLEPAHEALVRGAPSTVQAAHCAVLLERAGAAEVHVQRPFDRFAGLRGPHEVVVLVELLELDPQAARSTPELLEAMLRATDPKHRPDWAWMHRRVVAVANRADR